MKTQQNKTYVFRVFIYLLCLLWLSSAQAVVNTTWNSPILNQQYYDLSILVDADINSDKSFNQVLIVLKDENGNIVNEAEGGFRSTAFSEFSQKMLLRPVSLGFSTDKKHKITLAIKLLNTSTQYAETSADTIDIYWCGNNPCPGAIVNQAPTGSLTGLQTQYNKSVSSLPAQHQINYSLNASDAEGLASMRFIVTGADGESYETKSWNVSGTSETQTASFILPLAPQSYTAKLTVLDAQGEAFEKIQNFSTTATAASSTPIGQLTGIASSYLSDTLGGISSTPEKITALLTGLDDTGLASVQFNVSTLNGSPLVNQTWNTSATYFSQKKLFNQPPAGSYIATLTLIDKDGNQKPISQNFSVSQDPSSAVISLTSLTMKQDKFGFALAKIV